MPWVVAVSGREGAGTRAPAPGACAIEGPGEAVVREAGGTRSVSGAGVREGPRAIRFLRAV